MLPLESFTGSAAALCVRPADAGTGGSVAAGGRMRAVRAHSRTGAIVRVNIRPVFAVVPADVNVLAARTATAAALGRSRAQGNAQNK